MHSHRRRQPRHPGRFAQSCGATNRLESLRRGRKWSRRVDQAKRLHPDLILLDQSMPVMTGLEAARELRRLMPRVPLLMFTMFKNPFFEREAHAAGVSVVKSKSEDVQSLLVSIQELLKSANLITAI